MGRFGRKRLAVDLPIEIHMELMKMAEKYNITLTKYLLRLIVEKLIQEKKYE